MTRLRKMMVEELHRRNYSHIHTLLHRTGRRYLLDTSTARPDRLGLRHIREYQAELFRSGSCRQEVLLTA